MLSCLICRLLSVYCDVDEHSYLSVVGEGGWEEWSEEWCYVLISNQFDSYTIHKHAIGQAFIDIGTVIVT